MAKTVKVHLLDVGTEEYGDAVLCQLGDCTVLIDGAHSGNDVDKSGHPAIQKQIRTLLGLGANQPCHLTMVVVSHAHDDHIGCLPKLVASGQITCKWALVVDPDFGWGRTGDDAAPPPADARAASVFAALREEPRGPGTTDGQLEELLQDAPNLEQRYRTMLDDLAAAGTKVVRFGRNSTAALVADLKAKFGVTLKILGVRKRDLEETARLIWGESDALARRITDTLAADSSLDQVGLYRRLVTGPEQADATASRLGHLVNFQSVVTVFGCANKKLLFTGDRQLADPDVSDDSLLDGHRKLLAAVENNAPYDFVKLAHHGSFNGINDDILGRLKGSRIFGICAGERSSSHPSVSTLNLLEAHEAEGVEWARTDRNGQTTISFDGAQPTIDLEEGNVNDTTPPGSDLGPPVVPPRPGPAAPEVTTTSSEQMVEVVARIPHATTRVTITVDVQPGQAQVATEPPAPHPAPARPEPEPVHEEPEDRRGALKVGGGRQLPRLLFLTDRAALARNLGGDRAAVRVLTGLRAVPGAVVIDDAAARGATPAAIGRAIAGEAQGMRGIIIVGGYDVVPSERLDALPPRVRASLTSNQDLDDFIVWNDDGYAGYQDGLPKLPVSRVPDGGSMKLLSGALSAGTRNGSSPFGVRNVARAFAGQVFLNTMGGRQNRLLVSKQSVFNVAPRPDLSGGCVYLMLHGLDSDGTFFVGEGVPGNRPAVNLSNVPAKSQAVVLAGCCWGALIAERPAVAAVGGSPGHRAAGDSIALKLLEAGALAFVGCTGSHYSPLEAPYNYFGKPMHDAFWTGHINRGLQPAQALFEAKKSYARGIPHRPGFEAVELKILRQFTCLGLGW